MPDEAPTISPITAAMSTSPGTRHLFSDLDVEVRPDCPLGPLTWFGIGGRADCLVRPRSVEALAQLVRRCRRSNVPLRVLGSGANLLVAEEGVGGLVVRLDTPAFRDIRYNPDGSVDRLRAMAGADLSRTIMDTTRRGLAGLGHLAGIPASIGGAIRMNAGGAYGSTGDTVQSVTCLTRDGEIVRYPKAELIFDYRRTNIPDPIILSAVFDVVEDDPLRLREQVKEIFAYKKSTQPLASSSAGCIFRNPIDPETETRCSAGDLTDVAGRKALAVGGARVSRQHANFIVTEPGATASHVLQLIELIKSRVYDHAGIELREEIAVWRRGEGETP